VEERKGSCNPQPSTCYSPHVPFGSFSWNIKLFSLDHRLIEEAIEFRIESLQERG
jgi:hypothetical protein